jgi:hypothetical protein
MVNEKEDVLKINNDEFEEILDVWDLILLYFMLYISEF